MRRIRTYPTDWRSRPDEALYDLSLGALATDRARCDLQIMRRWPDVERWGRAIVLRVAPDSGEAGGLFHTRAVGAIVNRSGEAQESFSERLT